MSRTLAAALTIVALSASATLLAQQTTAPVATRGSTPQGQMPPSAAPPAARPIDIGIDQTDANVSIQIIVVDKGTGAGVATTTRSGSITVANQNNGSVRGLGSNYGNADTKLDPTGLDIDARATLRKSGVVSVTLTIGYVPAGTDPVMKSVQRQSATLFLKPGQETEVLTAGSMSGVGPAVRITAKAIVSK